MSKSRRHETDQAALPFGEAEGTAAERKSLLGMALVKVKADLHLAQLCLWTFNATEAGTRGRLAKSYSELASAPWGLCCGRSKVFDTVREARALGLLVVEESRNGYGSQAANEYAIDWEGVRRIIGLDAVLGAVARSAQSFTIPSATQHTPSATQHTPSATQHTPSVDRIHLKEYTFPNTSVHSSESESEGMKPRMAEALDKNQNSPRTASAWQDWMQDVPELREARGRRITPLPPGNLVYGAPAQVHEQHLADGSLVNWFRRQLSLASPFVGNSEAELLLVLAAGLASAAVPKAEVLKSRAAIFNATVSRRLWNKVLPHVRAARNLLDVVLQVRPECLVDPTGMGPAAESVAGGVPLETEAAP